MAERDFVIKQRSIWHPRSLQLLREKAAVQYALKTVPRIIDETRIDFPEVEVSLGPRVLTKSRRITGQSLLETIYKPDLQDFALDMAITALEALNRANVTHDPFIVFGVAYGLARKWKVSLREKFGGSILSSAQRATLNALVANYKVRPGGRKVLVHGDLHAGNVVVNYAGKSLGFVDLEMMHLGKPVTNFAQLWISFHFADPKLGRRLYQQYANRFSGTLGQDFDSDVRAEIALRCHSLVREGQLQGHTELEGKARLLLGNVLRGESFAEFVYRCDPGQ